LTSNEDIDENTRALCCIYFVIRSIDAQATIALAVC
jgi:hypothetical protein